MSPTMRKALKTWGKGSAAPKHISVRLGTAQALFDRGYLMSASGIPKLTRDMVLFITDKGCEAVKKNTNT